MSMTAAMANNLLDLYFTNVSHANIGDGTGLVASTTAGSFYISLHTADPSAGNQTTNEATYDDYARVAVARSGAAWTVAAANVSNAAAVSFPAASAGSDTVTHFGIGSDASGAGNLFWSAALDASRDISAGITPEFAIGELDTDAA